MPASRSVLLVGPDADAWSSDTAFEAADVTAAESVRDARAYLAGTTFDAVYVQAGIDAIEGLTALRDVLGLSTPIETVEGLDDLRARRSSGSGVVADDVAAVLDELKAELSRVAHSLNNPLAVITGNTQLALELAGVMGTDEGVVESLRHIAEAAVDLEARFAEISALRDRVDRLLGRT